MKGSSYLCSQITGGAENTAPLYVDIPHTGGRSSDPFGAVLQEYLQFPYKYFLLVILPFKGYCCKLFLSNKPQKKKSQGLRSGEHASQIPLLIILSLKISDKAYIDI
jgi:hypothetical protein